MSFLSSPRVWLGGFVAAALFVSAPAFGDDPPIGFRRLFDGRSLAGWEGDESVWRVEDGVVVGETKGIPKNQFLATTTEHRDFVLKLRFRLVDGYGNSGVQFRSRRIPNHHEMIGYQADVGAGYWGCLYDESRRNKVLAGPAKDASFQTPAEWNRYTIRCMNERIEMTLNDKRTVDYREPDASIPRDGVIALQVHSDPKPIRVDFTDVFIQDLPTPKTGADAEAADAVGFLSRELYAPVGKPRKYTVFIPADYHKTPEKKRAAILFLHGSGERGDDGELPAKVGLGPAVLARADSFPFIAVFPQALESWQADSSDGRHAMEVLDAVMKDYRVDPAQIHLTGLSMGGAGAWSLGAKHPGRWKTVGTMCGRGDLSALPALKSKPVWIFCGDKDGRATVDNCREAAQVLRQAGGAVKYTEYPMVGHNCWDLAYNTDEMYRWMTDPTAP
ncbi:MAG: family 16 glycoside hydrolase [Planctomycetia bacterium]